MKLMRDIRESIKEQRFPKFIQDYMLTVYPNKEYPAWIINALEAVNVTLL
jgi:queuine tRNA-ribosyltransferase